MSASFDARRASVSVNSTSVDRHSDSEKQDISTDDKSPIRTAVTDIISFHEDDGNDEVLQDLRTDVPFPVDTDAPQEQQFTLRAVLVGCALGAVISASKYAFHPISRRSR